MGLVYQYINMLRREGPQEWVFEELKAIARIDFQFAEEEAADDYTVRLASECAGTVVNTTVISSKAICTSQEGLSRKAMLLVTGRKKDSLQHPVLCDSAICTAFLLSLHAVSVAANMYMYPKPDTIFGDYVHAEWDPLLISQVLEYLTPSAMRLDLLTKTFDHSPQGQPLPYFFFPVGVKTCTHRECTARILGAISCYAIVKTTLASSARKSNRSPGLKSKWWQRNSKRSSTLLSHCPDPSASYPSLILPGGGKPLVCRMGPQSHTEGSVLYTYTYVSKSSHLPLGVLPIPKP